MKVEIQDIGPCQKKITVEVSEENVTQKINEEFIEVGTLVHVPGFRKGKIPRKILEKRYGAHVEEKVVTDLIEESLQEIIEEHSLAMIGDPKIENVNFERNKSFTFETILEVKPEFELPEYIGLELKKEVKSVSDEDIDYALQEVFEKTNKLVAVEDGKVEEKDIVICDLQVQVGEESLITKKEVYIYVGEDTIENLKVEGLKDHLLGKKNEDLIEFDHSLPKDFPQEEYRGKEGHFKITLLDIKRPKYKTPSPEWAEENDYDDLDEIKGYLSKEIKKNYLEESEKDLEQQLIAKLLEQVKFSSPPGMVEKSLQEKLTYEKMLHKVQRFSEEEAAKKIEEMTPEWTKKIQKEIQGFFLLDKIAKKEKIYVTETEIEERMIELAQRYGRNIEDLREEFEKGGNMSQMRWELREQKTIKFLLKKANIKG